MTDDHDDGRDDRDDDDDDDEDGVVVVDSCTMKADNDDDDDDDDDDDKGNGKDDSSPVAAAAPASISNEESTTTATTTASAASPPPKTTTTTTTTTPPVRSPAANAHHPPRPRSEWTIRSTPQDSSLLPTLGVTLWLGWNGFLVYLVIYLVAFAGTVGRTVAIGTLGLSLVLPRDVWNQDGDDDDGGGGGGSVRKTRMGIGRRFGYWCMRMAEKYFGLTTILENEPALDQIARDPSQKAVVFALEPHDILPYPVFAFSPALKRLPGRVGRDHSCLMTSVIFRLPILRQVYTWVSGAPIDKRTFRSKLERGQSFSFIPGGVQEVSNLDPRYPTDVVLYLQSRRGFVKLALAAGSCVVPAFCFGVDGSYGYWIPRGRYVSMVGRKMGFLPLFFWGRFGVPFGIPHPRAITVVVGSPIEFPKLNEKELTDDAVDAYHSLFLKEMEALYERHKVDAGYGDRKLRII